MGRTIHRHRGDRRRSVQNKGQEDRGRRAKSMERGAASAFLRIEVKIYMLVNLQCTETLASFQTHSFPFRAPSGAERFLMRRARDAAI